MCHIDFEIIEFIGEGQFGKVYKVKDKLTGKIYAAKMPINELKKDSDELIELSKEVDIISKLNYPTIIKFIFYSQYNFRNKLKPIIITEYALNGSLDKFIKQIRFI